MKKLLPLLVVGILVLGGLGAVALPDDNTKFEIKPINFSYPTITYENEFVKINMIKTNSFLMEQNKPLLPCHVQTFTFPVGTKIKSVSCKIEDTQRQNIPKYIMPTPKAFSAGKTIRMEETDVYNINYGIDPYPNTWLKYDVGRGIINDEQFVIVKTQVFPIQYHPANSMIEWANKIDIIVEYEEPVEPSISNNNYDFIVLAAPEYSDELAPLITHKNDKGISTIFVSLSDIYNGVHFPAQGRDDQEKIKYFIKNAIENWGTSFVLLVGGSEKFPVRETHVKLSDDDEIFVSDLYYADIYNETNEFCSWDSNENNIFGEYNWEGKYDEDDLHPDVYLGRLACVNGNEVIKSVNKIKTYEKVNQEAYKQHWFNDLVLIGGDHAAGDMNKVREGEFVNEKIKNVMDGFIPNNVNDSNGRLRGLIPTGVQEINSAINKGCGFIDFSGHGNTNVWATHPYENNDDWIPTPLGYYLNSQVKELSNKDELPIVIIGACSTCKFNKDPDCFGWSFILNNGGGGIAACGASGLDWFYYGEFVAEKGFEKICIDAFKAYNDGAMTFGEMWSGAINRYIYAGMDDLDHKTVEEFQPFGDPTLAIRGDSQAPDKPATPSGPTNGKTGTTYTYSTNAIDPDGDQVYFLFDWGDNSYSGWVGPFDSDATGSANHKWTTDGNYKIKVIAKDENGVIGEWSDIFTVTMPRNRATNTPFLKFLQQHPYLFPILHLLLQRLGLQ